MVAHVVIARAFARIRLHRKLACNKRGSTSIEYGLIAALIAVAAISTLRSNGSQLRTTFNTASSSMSAAPGAAPAPVPAPGGAGN